jgi:carboxyl-terminal processing protease
MRIKKYLIVCLPIVFVIFGFYLKKEQPGNDILLKVIIENLNRYHFSPNNINDSFSNKAFDQYIKYMDQGKRFLTQEDVTKMEPYRYKIDDEIQNGSYELLHLSIELINEAVDNTEAYFEEILEKPFDFALDEEVDFSDEIPYSKNQDELKERWKKLLKYNTLTRIYSDLEIQEKAQENNDTSVTILSFEELEEKARKSTYTSYEQWFKRLRKLEYKDRLNAYVNAIMSIYDPHTNYYPPADKENFDIQMSGKLEGIGAQLQEKDGYIKITNVIPGGPASLQGELQENDVILKVAQEGEEPVDIVDWRIDEAVKLIRGKKGTKVTLTVKKMNGSIQNITITRDVVILDETYAKSLVITNNKKKSAGYINLPSFYADFNDPKNGRFSWIDVKAEIEKLKSEKVDGLIIDLRNNGGGSLDDVIKMVGMFVKPGPVVQVKEANRPAMALPHNFNTIEWDGPLVILVNEFSASASEIMAAALQDYNRAIVIGSKQTHGKGTVQRFFGLNATLRDKTIPNLGSIKLTTQKFYRINGDATQLKGVTPDVIIPDAYMYFETGEKEHDFPIAWDQISPAAFEPAPANSRVPSNVVANSKKRVSANETFAKIEQNARRLKTRNEQKTYPLNLEKYKAQQAKEKELQKKFKNLYEDIADFEATNPKVDLKYLKKEESRKKRNEDWIKNVKKDPYVYEGLLTILDWDNSK